MSPTAFYIILHNFPRGKKEKKSEEGRDLKSVFSPSAAYGELYACICSLKSRQDICYMYVCVHMVTICKNLCLSALYVVCVWISFSKKKKRRKTYSGNPDRNASEPELYIENYTLVCQPLLTAACNTGTQRHTQT